MNYQRLFDYMNAEYGISMMESDMQEVCNIVSEMLDDENIIDKQLDALYLMKLHPELKGYEAVQLLVFCRENTIKLKGCYGDGSKMIQQWRDSMG